jgi:hypothetical protein
MSRNPGALTSPTPQGHVRLFRGYFTLPLPYLMRATYAFQLMDNFNSYKNISDVVRLQIDICFNLLSLNFTFVVELKYDTVRK